MTEVERTAKVKLPHGEGTVFWDERRQRYVAQKTVGYDGRGKAIVKTGIAKKETAAVESMRKKVKAHEAGLVAGSDRYTVKDAVTDWLTYGQGKAGDSTWKGYRFICNRHLLPVLGGRKLKDLTAQEVEKWLHSLTGSLGNSSLKDLHSCLNRSVKRAYARGLVHRNVVELVAVPEGRKGRASRSLTIEQVEDVLTLTKPDPMHAYIVVSVLTGARTEEVRALRWDRVDLDGDPEAFPPVPPSVMVWRSVREGGDTKTKLSRRTLGLPVGVVQVLRRHRERQVARAAKAGKRWDPTGLVFGTKNGTEMNARNVARDFRRALARVPGIDPDEWTPRDLRHTCISVLSASGVAIEEISRLAGHSGTAITELVYRHELRPVIQTAATAMDRVFAPEGFAGDWYMEPLFGANELGRSEAG
ncbi:site-specific integrase [Promicromonospora panici]|uniref:site-specific integrase n=1 Tax=Promicromonospora panici TaxID=2219658 RepID=UPI00101DF643|nr:site-specific integrase [Promicromonospora panici]